MSSENPPPVDLILFAAGWDCEQNFFYTTQRWIMLGHTDRPPKRIQLVNAFSVISFIYFLKSPINNDFSIKLENKIKLDNNKFSVFKIFIFNIKCNSETLSYEIFWSLIA